MKIVGEPKAFLSNEALQLLNLYESLGPRAEIFLPRHIFDNLTNFVNLCMEEPDDPAKQQAEINRYLLKFREDIPGYTDVSLMLIPHSNSKAFELSNRRGKFVKKINALLDTDGTTTDVKNILQNIRDTHDVSVGTPPINSFHIDFMAQVQLGGHIRDLRKYRDVIGVTGDINEAHWNYLMDTLEQMISQSGRLPDAIVACVGGGSNAMGLFSAFLDDKDVEIYGVEPAGKGLDTDMNAATIARGKKGILHGFKCYFIQDEKGEPLPVYSIASGLDYPGVGPQHCYLHDIKRVRYESATDREAVEAFYALSRMEGIIPALESSHAVAYAVKLAKKLGKGKNILVNLSGRGDKDIDFVMENYPISEYEPEDIKKDGYDEFLSHIQSKKI